jgi:hypothetical protein
VRQQLRRLAADELGEGSIRRLVALDAEVGVHRIGAGARREQVGGPRVEHAKLADLQAPLTGRLTTEGRHQHHRAAARDVQITVVEVEDRDRHAAGGEDRVVGQPGVEHVAEGLVGAGRTHRQRHASQRGARLAVRRASPAILHHRPRVLTGRQRIETGTERRPEGQRALVGAEPAGVDLAERALARIRVVHTFSNLPVVCPCRSWSSWASGHVTGLTARGYDNPAG